MKKRIMRVAILMALLAGILAVNAEASTLANLGTYFSNAGKVGNVDALERGTRTLIEHYREIEEQLKEHLEKIRREAGE